MQDTLPNSMPIEQLPSQRGTGSLRCEGPITGLPFQHGHRGQPLRQKLLALSCSPAPYRAALGHGHEQDRKVRAFVELTFQRGQTDKKLDE